MVLYVFIALIVIFVILPLVGAALAWVVWTAVVGVLLGGFARLIIPGRQNIGLLATIVCGWIGSLIGGAIGSGVWGFHHNHHHIATLLIEVGVSAVAVLAWSRTHRNSLPPSARQHRVIDI